jgi:hypothetical protein
VERAGLHRREDEPKTAAVNATGFVIDGEGKGAAVCKKRASGPWPVAVR